MRFQLSERTEIMRTNGLNYEGRHSAQAENEGNIIAIHRDAAARQCCGFGGFRNDNPELKFQIH